MKSSTHSMNIDTDSSYFRSNFYIFQLPFRINLKQITKVAIILIAQETPLTILEIFSYSWVGESSNASFEIFFIIIIH